MASKCSENSTKQTNRNYIKICIITNCKHNKYNANNANIKMFRVPTDERYQIWCTAINENSIPPYQGFVCIEHFRKDDLIGKKNVNLRKHAIPSIFTAIDSAQLIHDNLDRISVSSISNDNTSKKIEGNDSFHTADDIGEMKQVKSAQGAKKQYKSNKNISNVLAPMICCNSAELYDIAKAEYANLQEEYIELESKRCVEVEKLENELKMCKSKVEFQKQEIKYLSKKVSKLEKSEKSLKTLLETLKDLEEQNILSTEAYQVLEKIDKNEVLKCIIHGQPAVTKYPPEVRKFCFTLNYHSPAAYRIIRAQFGKRLPHPRTLAEWLSVSDINGEHGFNEETMKRLAGFVNELKDSTGEDLICTLMFDEMYIKKQVYWDQSKFQYVGYPTYEHKKPEEDIAPKERNRGAAKADKPKPINSIRRVTRAASASRNVDLVVEEDEMSTNESETGAKSGKRNKTKSPLATRAIVFMLSGLNKSFEFPVGYHFVNGLGGDGLTDLVSEVIIKVSEQGVKISNLTFDGAKDNLKMCANLGANLDPLSSDFKPSISSPYDGSKIYIILDPSHMEKLMRNLLGNHEILFDENNNKIEWSYFVALQKLTKDGNLLTHKLTKKHTTEFKRNKMNVRLAAETFSTSVADSFKILRDKGHQDFVNSLPTEMFTRMIDKGFDILNSRDTRHANVYKRPLNFENKRQIFEFMEQCIVSLKGLKMKQIRRRNGIERTIKLNVLNTINKTPVLGFLVNFTNIPLVYAQYVEGHENNSLKRMSHFRTYPLSQDRIELLFGKIRARNGHNNNPNCTQFKGAYRRLLANIEINPPAASNCMMFDPIDLHMFTPQSNVYSVTSRRPKIDMLSDETFASNLKKFEQQQQSLEALSDLAALNENEHLLEGFASASIAYVSKLIEESILAGEFYCDCCQSVFFENEKINSQSVCLVPSKTPCVSTYNICQLVDKYFDVYKPTKVGNVKDVDFRVLYYHVFKEIDYDTIFFDTDFKNHEQHRFYLVKMIVKNYIYMKTSQISKTITYDEYEKIIRSKLTKWIHFKGQ